MRRIIYTLPIVAGAIAGAIVALVIGSGTTTKTVTQVLTHASATPAVASVPSSTSPASGTALSINQVYKKDSAGVVDITVSSQQSSSASSGTFGLPGGSQLQEDEGTGVVYDNRGDIITDEHVVAGSDPKIEVHFQNGVNAPAVIMGKPDASTDVAVIRVHVSPAELHPIPFADSSTAQVGDSVVAIGSPFSLPETVTSGIVSAVGRTITAPNNYSINGAIQTDASINPGNSGGPLLNAQGEVLGLNDQIQTSSGDSAGVGFATPGNVDRQVADQMIGGKAVQHAYVGVCVGNPITGSGAEISAGSNCSTAIQSGSPAAKAGLQSQDVITKVDGSAITTADAFTAVISKYKPGQTVTMTVKKVGAHKTQTLKVTLGNRPATAPSGG